MNDTTPTDNPHERVIELDSFTMIEPDVDEAIQSLPGYQEYMEGINEENLTFGDY